MLCTTYPGRRKEKERGDVNEISGAIPIRTTVALPQKHFIHTNVNASYQISDAAVYVGISDWALRKDGWVFAS